MSNYKKNKKMKIVVTIFSLVLLFFVSMVILKPGFLYRSPLNIFGYCAYDVAVDNDFIYVTHNNGVNIIKVSDSKKTKTSIKTSEMANGVIVTDEKAYITGDNALLSIYNVENPIYPEMIATLKQGVSSVRSCIQENILFVSGVSGSLYVIDISNIDQAKILSHINIGGYSRGMCCYNGYLYIGIPELGVKIYDITDVSSLKEIRTIPDTLGVFDIHIKEDVMFLACHRYGFKAISITDPVNTIKLFSVNNGGEAYGVDANDHYIFIADLQDGFELWQNSLSPQLIYSNNKYVPHALTVVGNEVYIADQNRGLVIINLTKIVD